MIEYKLIAALLVLLAGAGGGALAARLIKAKAREKITGLANTFAGGVFPGRGAASHAAGRHQ
ncbi:MAG: hypothetical protein IIB64_05865 [Proteobacteria bacterium]|nr:hypothetical protein [Pseudomonadota bacterium]